MGKYHQGMQCTFKEDTEEYQSLKEFAALLTKNSPNKNVYEVEDCYLDAGQGWMWTTILNKTQGYQAICPRDWFDIVNREDFNMILENWLNDKYNPDRIK